MFDLIFFEDNEGNQPVKKYLDNLKSKKDKNSRILSNKISRQIIRLRHHGFALKYPDIRHISGDIWELRPLNNRIFFFCWKKKSFVLLHYFIKKSQKTPRNEIERAQKNLKVFLEREAQNGK